MISQQHDFFVILLCKRTNTGKSVKKPQTFLRDAKRLIGFKRVTINRCMYTLRTNLVDTILIASHKAKFMGPTWGPPGSCRPQMGPMLAPWNLLSGLAQGSGNSSVSNTGLPQSSLSHPYIYCSEYSLAFLSSSNFLRDSCSSCCAWLRDVSNSRIMASRRRRCSASCRRWTWWSRQRSSSRSKHASSAASCSACSAASSYLQHTNGEF